jgi:hypothetical protein
MKALAHLMAWTWSSDNILRLDQLSLRNKAVLVFSPSAMTLPPMLAPQSNGQVLVHSLAGSSTSSLAVGLLGSANGWNFPVALLRPLEFLFTGDVPVKRDNFLAGLRADYFLGAGVLPAAGKRATPLAWIAVELSNRAQNPFAELRGGCWMPGYPLIGRGRELLRAAGMADSGSLGALLAELGFGDTIGPALYFNFHYDQPEVDCARVYLLDAATRRLHGFALPCSALAQSG